MIVARDQESARAAEQLDAMRARESLNAAREQIAALRAEVVDLVRVCGAALCPTCQLTYREHPFDEAMLSVIDGLPYVRLGCDGSRLKL